MKIAAQVAIVSGLEAVAATAVAKARRGEATSSSSSPPSRTRNAAQSVRAPMNPSTSAPVMPKATRSASASRRLAAPGEPEPGVEQVDQGRAGADGDAAGERAAQHAADAQERHGPGLGAHEQAEAEADDQRAHAESVRPRASCFSSAASRSSHWEPTSAIQASASDIGAGVGR